MKHRAADNSRRYKILSEKFIAKYGISLENYDVIRGWRANALYFYIAKAFVRDEIDICILEELFHMGDFTVFNVQYNLRDQAARKAMKELINSDKNKVVDVFSTLL